MESKTSQNRKSKTSQDESKSEKVDEEDILQKAAEFFMGEEFQDSIDNFVLENHHLFTDQTEIYADVDHCDSDSEDYLPTGITRGHGLPQHAAYQSFQDLFELKLESFVERVGLDRSAFLRACKQAVADDAAGKETMGTVFVDLLLATSEYEGFVTMMASQSKELTRK